MGAILLLTAFATTPLPAHATGGRLVVIVLENKTYTKVMSAPSATPYIHTLVTQGLLFTNYMAVASGSARDYRAMTSGLTTAPPPPPENVFKAIDATAGALSWVELEESMTANCSGASTGVVPGTTHPLYTTMHDPAFMFKANETCMTNAKPLTQSTFTPANLPSLTYLIPNQCDDMHTLPKNGAACPAFDGNYTAPSPMRLSDDWLSRVVPQLLMEPDITVVLTWDEGTRTNNRIVTLEVGNGVTPGTQNATAYNHYSLEAGMYAFLGLGTPPNNGATAPVLPIPA
ncbi:MAG: phosphatidylinositol-3-phosphatase [Actinomycetota bacterium]|nr:phosphatidylinositol-3-phosphatase [Actinomycetota bacterium]